MTIETLDLNEAADTIVYPSWEDAHVIERVAITLPGVDGDTRKYGTGDWLANGILVGVYSRADDEPREEIFGERLFAGNMHYLLSGLPWELNVEIPADAYFGVKVQDDLTALEGHQIEITRRD